MFMNKRKATKLNTMDTYEGETDYSDQFSNKTLLETNLDYSGGISPRSKPRSRTPTSYT